MAEGAEDGCYDEQDENDDSDEVAENYGGIAAPAQGTVGDPDGEEGVDCYEGVADCGVFVLFCVIQESERVKRGKGWRDGLTI